MQTTQKAEAFRPTSLSSYLYTSLHTTEYISPYPTQIVQPTSSPNSRMTLSQICSQPSPIEQISASDGECWSGH